jgi:CelD/BcsL family acetyltransferase involved in cellulose biosynthesis
VSSKARSNLRQYERKLERDHGAGFERVDRPERLASAMEWLFDLHNHRWQAKRGSQNVHTLFSRADARAFHREVARNMLDAGMLDLTLLRAGDEVIGAHYSFEYNGSNCYYASGYRTDGHWSKFSLGAVMDFQGIRASIEAGLKYEDLLRNDGGYKARYSPERLDNQRLFIYRTRTARARCEAYYGLRSLARQILRRHTP